MVCPEERQSEYLVRAIDPFPFVTPIVVAPAGPTRQESAFSGLEFVPEQFEYVALHDGARPLITPDLIAHTIATLKGNVDCDGAVVAHPAVDTLKVVENGVHRGHPRSARVLERADARRCSVRASTGARTPAALSDGFVGTDDSSLIERLGGRVLRGGGQARQHQADGARRLPACWPPPCASATPREGSKPWEATP